MTEIAAEWEDDNLNGPVLTAAEWEEPTSMDGVIQELTTDSFSPSDASEAYDALKFPEIMEAVTSSHFLVQAARELERAGQEEGDVDADLEASVASVAAASAAGDADFEQRRAARTPAALLFGVPVLRELAA